MSGTRTPDSTPTCMEGWGTSPHPAYLADPVCGPDRRAANVEDEPPPYFLGKRARRAAKTLGGTRPETSPPKLATSRTRLEAT